MLFTKTEGISLSMKDWVAQSSREEADLDRDPLNEAALALWQRSILEPRVIFTRPPPRLQQRSVAG